MVTKVERRREQHVRAVPDEKIADYVQQIIRSGIRVWQSCVEESSLAKATLEKTGI